MDVYSEVLQPDTSELINSPFGGRYCGPIPPRPRVSLYRALALGFYTDKNASHPELFSGIYTFINDCECLTYSCYLIIAFGCLITSSNKTDSWFHWRNEFAMCTLGV